MKTIAKILLPVALIVPAGCAANRAPRTAGKTAPSTATALSVLRRSDPRTEWNAASEVRGDLDGDGVPDYALRGLRKDRVIVGIVHGPLGPRSKTWLLDFSWGKGTQDSLCSRDAKIVLEQLDESALAGAKPAGRRPSDTGGQGISLYDDRCDAFHIYWSPDESKFDWWRL
jgi:hypothetical protein